MIKYLFFDSEADDVREYPAADFADYFSRFLTSGIYNGGDTLQVSVSGTDMTSTINAGYGMIKGYMVKVDEELYHLNHGASDPQNSRIDRVVLRLNLADRNILPTVIKGTPELVPKVPPIVREGDIYDISLAQVYIVAGRSYISEDSITDERLNSEVCGIINSTIQADTEQLWKDFKNAWDAWFAQQQLDGVATLEDIADREFEVSAPDPDGIYTIYTEFYKGTTQKYLETTVSEKNLLGKYTREVTNYFSKTGLLLRVEEWKLWYTEDGVLYKRTLVGQGGV